MFILFIIVFGMAAGWVAQLILGRQTDWGQALVAGLIGSVVGGMLINLINGDGIEFGLSGLIGSVVGAVIVLGLWGAMRRGTAKR